VTGINMPLGAEVAMRKLSSENVVPAITADNPAGDYTNVLTLIESTLTGGNGPAAIVLKNDTGASLPGTFVRDVQWTGYEYLVSTNGTGQNISTTEWSSQTALKGTEAKATTSLDLTVAETPPFPDDTSDGTDYSSWAFPANPGVGVDAGGGCVVNDESKICNWTASIQAAIDSPTTSTVVIPWGWYGLDAPLYVGAPLHGKNVKRILCMGCRLTALVTGIEALVIGDTKNDTFWAQGLRAYYYSGTPHSVPNHFGESQNPYPDSRFVPVISNQTNHTAVVIQEAEDITYLDAPAVASGPFSPVYLESTAFGPFIFVNRQVWARDLDPEVAPASPAFLACNTAANAKCATPPCINQPADYLSQGNSHVVVTQTVAAAQATLWALSLKTENREWPNICNFNPLACTTTSDCVNSTTPLLGAGWWCDKGQCVLPANSLLEVDSGARAEVLLLPSVDHRVSDLDVNGLPTAAVVTNDGLGVQSGVSIEGFFDHGDSQEEYSQSVVQSYGENQESWIYQNKYCANHSSVTCAYSNGYSGSSYGPGSAYPLYLGYSP
jgi:hypothetical protein